MPKSIICAVVSLRPLAGGQCGLGAKLWRIIEKCRDTTGHREKTMLLEITHFILAMTVESNGLWYLPARKPRKRHRNLQNPTPATTPEEIPLQTPDNAAIQTARS